MGTAGVVDAGTDGTEPDDAAGTACDALGRRSTLSPLPVPASLRPASSHSTVYVRWSAATAATLAAYHRPSSPCASTLSPFWYSGTAAAAVGGLLLAALYAVFSGWGVPAQRTVLMLGTVTLLRDGRYGIVAGTPVGKEVDVTLLRNKEEMTKKVTVGRLEDGEKVASADPATPEPKPDAKPTSALGLELSGVTDALRKTYSLKPGAKGVVVTKVTPDSTAADKGMQPGDLVQEVNQQAVEKPADVTKAIDALKKAGKKTALLLVANAEGDVRFVALALN